jgi:tetratricopeptide (TPR) repeat protein
MSKTNNFQKIKKFLVLSFGFTFCVLRFAFNCYALDIDKVKVYFLNGDYKSAISDGEKVLTNYNTHSPNLDELYYILGLSYLKDGNYLRASDIFEIILGEFKDGPFKDEAKLSLGDTYFLKGDYDKAQGHYSDLINSNPRTKLKALLYYRISQIALKEGDTQQAKEYLDKLKIDFPSSLEIKLNKDLYVFPDIYYTVQVGSFVNFTNARNLCDKLISKGYDAYLQEADTNSTKTYRVKAGRLKSRPEATQLENELSSEGYPTKIIP